MELRLGSWNIAGGRLSRSASQFDYEDGENISYFAEILRQHPVDVLCIQETHTSDQRSLAEELGALVGLTHVYNSPASPSHIDPDYRLGNAILSRIPFSDARTSFHPDPWFPLHFKDGRSAPQHPKNIQMIRIEHLTIAHTHLLPGGLLGFSYDDGGLGSALAERIDEHFLELPTPLIMTGDFNYPRPTGIFPKFFEQKQLLEVPFDARDTSDHTYVTPGIAVLSHQVIVSKSDHDLYISRFQVD